MPFHTDKYCQILLSTHRQVVFIKHVHCVEAIYGNLLDSSLYMWLSVCPHIADESLPVKVNWKLLSCAVAWMFLLAGLENLEQ